MEKWWVIEGVRQPVYIGLEGRGRGYGVLIVAVFILSLTLGEIAGFLPSGITILVSTILLILEGVLNLLTGYGRLKLGKTDTLYIQNLLKTLSTNISKWSIPSRNTPVVATTNRGVYIVLYYQRGILKTMIFKPVVYYGVKTGKPVTRIKKIKSIEGKKLKDIEFIGVADIVFPHPEIKNMNYKVRAKTIVARQDINPHEINTIIEKFNEYFVEGGVVYG